jgi:hypothetical protein
VAFAHGPRAIPAGAVAGTDPHGTIGTRQSAEGFN